MRRHFQPGEPADDTCTIRIEGLLGQGRHGTVLAATGDDGQLAIKRPRSLDIGRQEAAALERFAHPNVVALAGPVLDDGSILLERLPATGASAGPLPVGAVASIADQCLDALTPMHAAGWIHGDLSPANIGLRGDGSVALIDFASSRPADGSPLDCGTSTGTGPLRTAETVVDVRALSAALCSMLGDVGVWSAADEQARSALASLIADIDERRQAPLNAIADVFVGISRQAPDVTRTVDALTTIDSAPTAELRPATSPAKTTTGGGTTRGWSPTTSFGPGRPTLDHDPTPPTSRSPRALTAVIALAIIAGLGIDAVRADATPAPPGGVADMAEADAAEATSPIRVSPDDALRRAGVEPPDSDGMLIDPTTGITWAVGNAGDVITVGDWDCDGSVTPGVWSPSTREWFAFDDWAQATVRAKRLVGSGDLAVELDPRGCATASLTRG